MAACLPGGETPLRLGVLAGASFCGHVAMAAVHMVGTPHPGLRMEGSEEDVKGCMEGTE